jgi:hypothetical protein
MMSSTKGETLGFFISSAAKNIWNYYEIFPCCARRNDSAHPVKSAMTGLDLA